MTDEAGEANDALTSLGKKTIERVDDDRPPIGEMDQQENESDEENYKRLSQKSRGTEYDQVYLHESGWVKVVFEDPMGLREGEDGDIWEDEDVQSDEFWFPPRRIEVIR